MEITLVAVLQLLVVLALLLLLHAPVGDYIAWTYSSARHWRVERWVYRGVGVDPETDQRWPTYLRSVLIFSLLGVMSLYAMLRLQQYLPWSEGHGALSPALAFNTAVSFVANTNWQAYAGESTLGYFAQMAGLTVQSFVSAAVGLAVAMTVVRGFARRRTDRVGNFWVDLVRGVIRILLPLSVVAAIVFMVGGVIQNLSGATDIVTVAGGHQSIPGGPVASQESIKFLGTNGGGFFNANSAHPFENPSAMTNLLQVLLLLLIPFSLPRTLGRMVGDRRIGHVIVAAMGTLFVAAFTLLLIFEADGRGKALQLAGAAMEGKEQRFGRVGSALFTTATTGTSGGASNAVFDSFSPFGGVIAMIHMTLGEVSPGGVGTGLYTVLVLAVITVFITGLLLGRAPMLLGKKIGVRELKLASLFILVMPVLALGGLAVTFAIPSVRADVVGHAMGNSGVHGMSEAIYAFLSAAINNGSGFGGFDADTTWLNTILGIVILLGRFVPIVLVVAVAGSLGSQPRSLSAAAELPLYRPQFVGLFIGVIIFISVPTFIPILMVGPFAEGLG